jgi:hypothetical protein
MKGHGTMKAAKLWTGLALAAAILGGSKAAHAQAGPMLTFIGYDLTTTYSVLGEDNLRMGLFQWVDGKYYVGVVDDVTCKTYFLLRNGAVMENGLTGHSNVQLGGGFTDRFFVHSVNSPSVGGGGQICPSAPELFPLNHGGYRLTIMGQAGNDILGGGYTGSTYMYGGSGHDSLTSEGAQGVVFGDSGRDNLRSHFIGCLMYGGDDADFLEDWHTPFVYGESYFGEAGNDCIWDPDTFTSIDCGPGDDRRGGAAGTAVGCEGTVATRTACHDWVYF